MKVLILAVITCIIGFGQQIDYNRLKKLPDATNLVFQQPGGIVSNVAAVLKNCPFDTQYVDLQTAINNIPAGGCLTALRAVTIASPLTITNSNITINFMPGSSVTRGVSGMTIVGLTASNTTINGLTLLGNYAAHPLWGGTDFLVPAHVDNLTLNNLTIADADQDLGFYANYGVTNLRINNPHIKTGHGGIVLIASTDSSNTVIDGGTVENVVHSPITGDGLIAFQVVQPTGVIANLTIKDTIMRQGGTNFCVTVGDFAGGMAPGTYRAHNVTVQNTTCINTAIGAASTAGPISFAGVDNAQAINNYYDGANQIITYGLESGGANHSFIGNNLVNFASGTSVIKDGAGTHMRVLNNYLSGTINILGQVDSTDIQVIGNTVLSGAGPCINAYTGAPGEHLDRLLASNNNCIGTTGSAVFFAQFSSGSTFDKATVVNNIFKGYTTDIAGGNTGLTNASVSGNQSDSSAQCSISCDLAAYIQLADVKWPWVLPNLSAATVNFQQPGGIPSTVQAALQNCPFDVQYATLARAVANIPANGCLNVVGVWTLTAALTVPSNVTIYGQPEGSIKAGASGIILLNVTGATRVTFVNLNIDGNSANFSGVRALQADAASSYVTVTGGSIKNFNNNVSGYAGITFNGSHGDFNGISFSNIGNGTQCAGDCPGITGTDAHYVRIKDNTFDMMGGNPVHFFSTNHIPAIPGDYIRVEGNIAHNLKRLGIEFGPFVYNKIEVLNNYFDTWTDVGFGISIGFVPSSGVNCRVSGNTIYQPAGSYDESTAGTTAYEILADYCITSENFAYGSWGSGITIGGHDQKVIHNYIQKTVNGIVNNNSSYFPINATMEDNTVIEPRDGGIAVGGQAASGNKVVNNTIIRTPGSWAGDATRAFVYIDAENYLPGADGPAPFLLSGNELTMERAAIPVGFTAFGFSITGAAAFATSGITLRDNLIWNKNVTPIITAYRSQGPAIYNGLSGVLAEANRYVNVLAIGFCSGANQFYAENRSMSGFGVGVVATDCSIGNSNLSSNLITYQNETGASNALAGTLFNAPSLYNGLIIRIQLGNGHTLQAGANTFNFNGTGALAIKKATAPGTDLTVPFGTSSGGGGTIELMYQGYFGYWVALGQ